MRSTRVAVVGGSGFVGRAVVAELRLRGAEVVVCPAPRVQSVAGTPSDVIENALAFSGLPALSSAFDGVQVVINAAGVADAGSGSESYLLGANSVLPRIVREAAVLAGASRFVHISSAAVQGRREPLDETRSVVAFSAYSRSKALGEQALWGCPETVVFRPTSVHGVDRRVSRAMVKVASSPLASVAGDGTRPTPQVLVENVGSAIAFVGLYEGAVPEIVMQPWEGLTTAGLISLLGHREPRHVPRRTARALLASVGSLGRPSARVTANVRRLEMLWFGQRQVDGWLTSTSWEPRLDNRAWERLRGQVASGSSKPSSDSL